MDYKQERSHPSYIFHDKCRRSIYFLVWVLFIITLWWAVQSLNTVMVNNASRTIFVYAFNNGYSYQSILLI